MNNESYLGYTVTDNVTGLRGIVTCEATYLYGCVQVSITPAIIEGKVQETHFLDKARVTVDSSVPRINPIVHTTGNNVPPPSDTTKRYF